MKTTYLIAAMSVVAVAGCGESSSTSSLDREISVANAGERVTLSVPAMV